MELQDLPFDEDLQKQIDHNQNLQKQIEHHKTMLAEAEKRMQQLCSAKVRLLVRNADIEETDIEDLSPGTPFVVVARCHQDTYLKLTDGDSPDYWSRCRQTARGRCVSARTEASHFGSTLTASSGSRIWPKLPLSSCGICLPSG